MNKIFNVMQRESQDVFYLVFVFVIMGVIMVFSIYYMKVLCLFIDIMSLWIDVFFFFYVSQVSFLSK